MDLNATNLMWLDDPIQIKKIGLSKPSIVLYELSPGVKIDQFYKNKYDFDDFLKILDRSK